MSGNLTLAAPLVVQEPVTGWLYVTLTSVTMLSGTVGNMLILVTILSSSTGHLGNEFVFNLALADLCVAAVAQPMCIIGAVSGEEFFADRPFLCDLIGCLCLTACFCAFLSLTFLTVHRYVYVKHNHICKKIFNRYVNVTLCILFWILAGIMELPNFLGWGGHLFDVKNHSCIWNRVASFSYTLLVVMAFISVPLLVMLVLNILLARTIWKWSSQANIFDQKTSNAKQRMKSCKSIMVIFCVFCICWLPYTIVIAIDFEDQLSMETHLWTTWLAHGHSAINWIIFMGTNSSFRKACLLLVKSRPSFSCSIRCVTPVPVNSIVPINKPEEFTGTTQMGVFTFLAIDPKNGSRGPTCE